MSDINQDDPKKQIHSSPTAGCIIIMLAMAMFAGIAGYGIYAGITQDKDIATFASEDKMELPKVEATAKQVTDVRERLEAWTKSAKSLQPAELRLTAHDLNTLVDNNTALIESRGTIYFDDIKDERIHAQISLPINRIAFWKDPRHLNGTCTIKLESGDGRIFVRFDTFDIPKAAPNPGFIERMQQSDILAPYKSDKDLEKIFNKNALSIRIEGDAIVVETKPLL